MIVIVILIFVIWLVISIRKSGKTEKENSNTDVIKQIEKKRIRLHIRDKRRERQRRIWSVLFLLSSHNDIISKEFPTKKQEQNLIYAKASIKEYQPDVDDLKTAIRFCKIENVRGKCKRVLTDNDIKQIFDDFKNSKGLFSS